MKYSEIIEFSNQKCLYSRQIKKTATVFTTGKICCQITLFKSYFRHC